LQQTKLRRLREVALVTTMLGGYAFAAEWQALANFWR
jgi:hypothetical protein